MTLTLERFTQEVDIKDPTKVDYFLVMRDEYRRTLRLPVLEETTKAICEFLYGEPVAESFAEAESRTLPPEEEPSEEEEGLEEEDEDMAYVSSFGGDYVEQHRPPSRGPRSEDEVPSL